MRFLDSLALLRADEQMQSMSPNELAGRGPRLMMDSLPCDAPGCDHRRAVYSKSRRCQACAKRWYNEQRKKGRKA